MTVEAKYHFSSERVEWLAVVYEQRGENTHVLIVGAEDTKHDIKTWIEHTLKRTQRSQRMRELLPWLPLIPCFVLAFGVVVAMVLEPPEDR